MSVALAAGWLLDRALGEPPAPHHPVARFGTLMSAVERRTYAPNRVAGVAHLTIGVGIAGAAGLAMQRLIGRRAALVVATTGAVAGRMLAIESGAVLDLVARGDLDAARERVRGLVGRDPDVLGEADLVRAVIESQAENTVDAVIAPLWWGAVAGAPGVLIHRAINTLDAMVGHRNARYERFGWAAARADDAANFVPARIAAVAVAALTPRRALAIGKVVRRDAAAHPSPNGGVVEAAVAAALDVRLGGANRYAGRVDDRGVLGDGRTPTPADGRAAISLTTAAGGLVAGALTAVAALAGPSPRRRWSPLSGRSPRPGSGR